MVPPLSFSTAAPQSSRAFFSGCDAVTHRASFRSKVFSCANAGVTLAASSNAKNVFLIDIFSPRGPGFDGPLRLLLYDIIIIASTGGANDRPGWLKPIIIRGASIADKSCNHWRGPGGVAARTAASHLWKRQRHPGAPDAGLRARPHPRRPSGRGYGDAARRGRRRHPRPPRGAGA